MQDLLKTKLAVLHIQGNWDSRNPGAELSHIFDDHILFSRLQNFPREMPLIKLISQLPRLTLGNGLGDQLPVAETAHLLRPHRGAIRRRLEQRQRELLGDHPDVEVDEAGAGDVDPDPLDGEPQEQLLRGDPGEGADLAVAQRPGDVPVVVQLALELGVAGPIQVHLELPVGVDPEARHPLGEQPHREAVGLEDLVDGRGGEGVEERDEEEEREEGEVEHGVSDRGSGRVGSGQGMWRASPAAAAAAASDGGAARGFAGIFGGRERK